MVKRMEFRKSSTIQAAEYDGARKTLDIVFSDGSCFTYYEVPDREYEGLVKAASAAGYFKKRIRDKYMCEECIRQRTPRANKNAGTRKPRRTLH
ncbi:KTSC domain-containing protein [Hyphomicrobium sp. 99]|uniref:KTSC domain-containing protein n=1 Tax=Hyphomicrobium sp. 99 TaxID=1163419 RepID=UPI000695B942|nr:KTSC domain-containing protein [Hyphomicrobium sp. 99]